MEISNLTKKRIKDYLEAGKRFDGRKLLEHREILIETGVSKNAEGSARVKLGNAEVVAGVKLGVGEPYTDSEDRGTLITTMELLPLSSEEFDYGPPRINAIEIARIVDRGIRESGMIDFEKLCIKKAEKVWTVFVDIYSINDDGNLLDASCFAAVAALLDAKMPKYDEKEERVAYGEWTSKKVPLREEEASSEARVSMALSSKKDLRINAMQKGGETALSEEEILKIIYLAEEKYKDIEKEIMGKIEKNLKGKKD